MSQLTIKISDKADALIAQLQKEIFNRRRKKVTAEGVVETLLESGAKSQSDKRFATSWQNLVADIEKAAMIAQAHGSKPSALSDEEWALVLNHRTRASTSSELNRAIKPRATAGAKVASAPPAPRRAKTAAVTAETPADEVIDPVATRAPKARGTRASTKAKPTPAAKAATTTTAKAKGSAAGGNGATGRKRSSTAAASKTPTTAKAVVKPSGRKTAASTGRSSVARRMAKAASRLVNAPITALSTPQSPSASPAVHGGNGVDNGLSSQPAIQ
jgi:hypothetical protein